MLIDHKTISDWAFKQLGNLDYSSTSLIKRDVYAELIKYVESLPGATSTEYTVDYTCPERNGFIESSERCIN